MPNPVSDDKLFLNVKMASLQIVVSQKIWEGTNYKFSIELSHIQMVSSIIHNNFEIILTFVVESLKESHVDS